MRSGPEIYAAGIEALNVAESNPEVRSVVIVGEGACSAPAARCSDCRRTGAADPSVQAESIDALHSWIDSIRTFPKPVIAAVEGAAAGAGFSLALACDFIVAGARRRLRASTATWRCLPDGGASWHLSQRAAAAARERMADAAASASAPNGCTRSAWSTRSATAARRWPPRWRWPSASMPARRTRWRASRNCWPKRAAPRWRSSWPRERDHFVRNLHHANAGIGIAAFLAQDRTTPRYE